MKIRSLAVLLGFVPLASLGQPAGAPSDLRLCTELFTGHTSIGPGVKGAAQPQCLWKTRRLHVRFLEGDPVVKARVEKIAKEWTPYTGIELVFDDSPKAQIRISFQPTGSWSYVGACQADRKPSEATMYYGWLTPNTDEAEYRRVVLHEFGHALGMVHEHQNPTAGRVIKWNEEAVYEYYRRTQNWDREKTRFNVLYKYSERETNFTDYDSTSIMQYAIPAGLTLDGFSVGWNNELSEKDKEFMRTQYRVRVSPSPAR